MLPFFVLELVEPEVELEFEELELLDEPVLEESDALVEAASSLSDPPAPIFFPGISSLPQRARTCRPVHITH